MDMAEYDWVPLPSTQNLSQHYWLAVLQYKIKSLIKNKIETEKAIENISKRVDSLKNKQNL